MDAMQYEINLPADYDMTIIRERVASRGHLLDGFPGLGLKAYLIREGAPVNQYAPFYLWVSPTGMNRFLWGGAGFQGIVTDFGRPAVRHWTGAAFEYGPARAEVPRFATRHTERLGPDEDPAAAVERSLTTARYDVPGMHSTALAVDSSTWELVRFTLWTRVGAPASWPGIRYEVPHLSLSEQLRTGRQW